jgi:hypothetical protein
LHVLANPIQAFFSPLVTSEAVRNPYFHELPTSNYSRKTISMIKHALRGAPELSGRFVCLSCFPEISTLFHRHQLRNYAVTTQSQAAELKPQDNEVEAGPLEMLEITPTTYTAPTKRTEKRKRPRSGPVPVPRASFRNDSVSDPKRLFREAQRKMVDTEVAAARTPEPQGLQDRVNNTGEKALPDKTRARMTTHRSARRKGVPFSGAFLNSTIKEALLDRDGHSQKKASRLIRKGTSPDNIQVIDSSTLHIQREPKYLPCVVTEVADLYSGRYA